MQRFEFGCPGGAAGLICVDGPARVQNHPHSLVRNTNRPRGVAVWNENGSFGTPTSGTSKAMLYDKTREGTAVVIDNSKLTSVKSYDHREESVQKVTDPAAEKKSKVTDRTRKSEK